MPPKTKQQKRMQELRKKQLEASAEPEISPNSSCNSSPVKIPADVHVTATLLSGSTYTQTKELFSYCNIDTVAESTFYEHQKKIIPIIEQCAQESVSQARELVKDVQSPSVSIDSRWSSRRNGSQNTATAIEASSKKVIAYKNTIKTGGKRQGEYEGPSNMMESAGVTSIAQELNTVFGSRNIDIVHDGDNKSDKIYSENGCVVTHHYDKNHAKCNALCNSVGCVCV